MNTTQVQEFFRGLNSIEKSSECAQENNHHGGFFTRARRGLAAFVRIWVPSIIAALVVIAALSWGFYRERQLSTERAELLQQSEAARADMIEREQRLQEMRRRQIKRFKDAIAAGEAFEAAIYLASHADELRIDGPPTEEQLISFSTFVDELIAFANTKAGKDAANEPTRRP